MEREKTIEKFQDFLKNGLKKTNPNEIKFLDIHRLPRQPIKKKGRLVHRPIIVKLLTICDKNLFLNRQKILDKITPHVKKVEAPI